MVKAWEHPDYRKNAEEAVYEPCCICGKSVADPLEPVKVVLVSTSGDILPANYDQSSADCQGGFPVGPSCYRKHKAFFRELGYPRSSVD